MNDERTDLALLRRELSRVEADLLSLRRRADDLEDRISARHMEKLAPPVIQISHAPPPPPRPAPPSTPKPSAPAPAPLAPVIPQESLDRFFQSEPIAPAPAAGARLLPSHSTPPSATIPKAEPASFEMRLGTYWFVRIGIVMVLTAMVFLGNYAYQHYIPRFGPLGKLVLLYLGSGALLAAGTILPRRHERLKNYGQVLFAGGLAAVYFTTYAAHHFENLFVIKNAVLDGVLLIAWTSFIVWLADRKQSETLAIFAIGLAYYAALITNVGSFTIVSNLFLAAAAVLFLIRNRWAQLTFLSLVASYGSYVYWRYYAGSAHADFDSARLAILGYWIIFTSAVFLSRHEIFVGATRAGFLSFNNAAAFALITASYYPAHTGAFWKLSIISGAVLLGLAALAMQMIKDDLLPRRSYLAQGLLLVTLGLITKLSGPTLALVLAAESAFLLICSTQWKSRLLQSASAITAFLAAGWLIFTLHPVDPSAWWKAIGVCALLLFNAVWTAKNIEPADRPLEIRQFTILFSFLGIASWTAAVLILAETAQVGPILALSCLAFTFSQPLLRVREITFLAQGLALIAQFLSLSFVLDHPTPAWSPLAVIGASLTLALWWKRQQFLTTAPELNLVLQTVNSFAAAIILYAWGPQQLDGDLWIPIAAALTIAWTAFGASARSWPLVAPGQIFLLGSSATLFARLLDNHEPLAKFALCPIIALVGLAAVAQTLSNRPALARPLKGISHFYHWGGTILTLAFVMTYVPAPFRFLTLTFLFIASLAPLLQGIKYTTFPGFFLAAAGLFYWIVEWRTTGHEPQQLLAILLLAATQVFLRKKPALIAFDDSAHQAWIITMSAALWLYISGWVIAHSGGAHFYLTASWALVAFLVLVAGLALCERAYRWSALAILTAAVGRVVLLDVWKLQTLYRILSFFAIGLVLLALGYIYTRFQEKISKWL